MGASLVLVALEWGAHRRPSVMLLSLLAAWGALEPGEQTELLITRVQFPPGRSNGIALARMARIKRRDIHIVFVARREFANQVDEQDAFLPMPVAVRDVVDVVKRLLAD